MAVDFGNTIIEGEIAPSVAVQNPVQDDSGSMIANAFAPAAKLVGQVAGSVFAQQAEDGKYQMLNDYENESLDVIDAYEQGKFGPNGKQEAMLRLRNIRSQYLANAPALRDDVDKVWTQLTKDGGFGHVVVEGTVADRAAEAKSLEAATLGYTDQQYEGVLAETRVLDAWKRKADLMTQQNGFLSEGMKQQGLEHLTNLSAAAVPAAQKMTNDTIAAIDAAGNDPVAKAEIIKQYDLKIGTALASIEGGALGQDAAFITKPMKDLQAMVASYAAGTTDITMLENQAKTTQLLYNQMQMQDPTTASYIAQANLFKELGLSNNTAVMEKMFDAEVIKRLSDNSKGFFSNLLDNTPAAGKTMQSMAEAAAVTGLSPEAEQEVMDFINIAADGVYLNERSAKDGALGYKDTVAFLANPAVRDLVAKNGWSAEHVAETANILRENYEVVLGPAINQYWTSVPITDPTGGERVAVNNIPMNQLLEPVWNGSAVEFVPKAEYLNNPRVVALAGEVNTGSNSIGIPLNDNINAQANLTGQDAKTLWERDYAQKWFGISEGGIADKVNAALDVTNTLSELQPETFTFDQLETNQASALTGSTLPPLDPAYTDVGGISYDSYLPSIRSAESGGNDSAANPTSTALGRYQFLKSTWDDLVKRYPNTGITFDGRTDPNQQEVAIRLFTAENARFLAGKDVALNNGTLYAAHFLGAGDAAIVLKAPDDEPLSNYLSSRVISANSFLRGKTVAWFKDWAQRKGNG